MLDDTGFSIIRVFQRTLVTWVRNLISFTVLSGLIHAPLILMLLMGGEESLGFLHSHGLAFAMLVGACSMLVHAAIAYSIAQQLLGSRARITESMVMALERVVPLVAFGILVGLLGQLPRYSTGTMGMGGLGTAASTIINTLYIVTIPVLVLERVDAIKALITSQDLTHGHRLPILFVCILMGLASVILSRFAFEGDMAETDYRLLTLFGFLVLTPFKATVTMAIYQELRVDETAVASHRAFPKARARKRGKSRAE